ncbi:IclR family transcriptional regulator [Candidatus Oscillochloris fontis]|uniref:IclR family transcriptional regulator n=1 Tax=Candidatus Oscillochloris fontis TaxID=2496868 RepID=UPI00101CFF9A|nr:IclR family transcriptional regulator [Candidatus Oscillochloris fontis]
MIQSLDRALDVLEALAEAEDDLSVSQLSGQLGLPVGTVHRLLNSLAGRGYVSQDPSNRRYGPGPQLLQVATRAATSRRFSLAGVARPALQRLTEATGETSNLLVLQGREVAYSEQVPSPHLVRLFTEVGQRVPLYCTAGGKAILATMPEVERERYLAEVARRPWTTKTLVSAEALRSELHLSAERGFALDDEERDLGVCCVAAPIFDRTGRCIAALSISGPSNRLSIERAISLGPQVCAEALACSAALGFVGKD